MFNKTKYWYYITETKLQNNNLVRSEGIIYSKTKYFPLKNVENYTSKKDGIKCIFITFNCEISKKDFEYKYAQLSQFNNLK